MRERFLADGGDGFQDYELLEFLLTLAIPRRDTKPLAKALIERFGSFAEVIAASPEALAEFDVSEAANKMSGTPAPAAALRPPRKPAQQKR